MRLGDREITRKGGRTWWILHYDGGCVVYDDDGLVRTGYANINLHIARDRTECWACEGTGIDPEEGVACDLCDGAGVKLNEQCSFLGRPCAMEGTSIASVEADEADIWRELEHRIPRTPNTEGA